MVDVITNRKSFVIDSSNVINLAAEGKVELYASALSFVNAFYVSRKHLGKTAASEKISLLHKVLKVSPMGQEEMDEAVRMHGRDFEDSLQYWSAAAAGCDAIVTRNIKDFPESGSIKVMRPGEFLDLLA